jgi:hypothetical protein
MKRICSKVLILALFLLLLMLTGCQPTPETPVVVGKNDGDNKVTALFGETSETEGPYTAPQSWLETLLTLNAMDGSVIDRLLGY